MNDIAQLHEIGNRLLNSSQLLLRTDKKTADGIMSDCCRIIGGKYENSLKEKYILILSKMVEREDITLEECWQIYWNINRALFVNFNLKPEGFSIREFYDCIYDVVHSFIDYGRMPYRNLTARNPKLIVLTTSQFLGRKHAPTQRVLDYAYTLQHELGFQIIILNDAGMHYVEHEHLAGVIRFNYYPELVNQAQIDYKDEAFEFIQVAQLMPDMDVINQLLNLIYDLNPALVYNVGGSSLVSDLCSDFVTTCSMPCSLQLPITMGDYLLLARNIEEADQEEISRLRKGQKVIESNFNYIYRKSDRTYTRQQFGIGEDEFVLCAVGNRLGEEVDDEFLHMLRELLSRSLAVEHPVSVVFVGPIDDERRTEIIKTIGEEFVERVRFTGSIDEAAEFIKLCNVCINPDRSGGGRAAFEAYCHGIPSVSLRKGDAYYVGGAVFGVDNYSEYAERILIYANSPDEYSKACKIARERSLVLSDMVTTQQKILKSVLV